MKPATLENFGALSAPNPLPFGPQPIAPGDPSLVLVARPRLGSSRYPSPDVQTMNVTLTARGGRVTALRVEAINASSGEPSWHVCSASGHDGPTHVRGTIQFPPAGLAAGESMTFPVHGVDRGECAELRIFAAGDASAAIVGSVAWNPDSR